MLYVFLQQHSTLYVPGAISDNDLDENTPTNSTSQPKRNSFSNVYTSVLLAYLFPALFDLILHLH